MQLEIAAQSLTSARHAQVAGAHRIELCAELGVGGLTPSYGLITQVLEELELPVHILIRPRSGDFMYNETELSTMERDIHFCVSKGCAGVVAGALTKDLQIDKEATARLQEAAGDLNFTFHRAFDWTSDPLEAFDAILELGVDTLLTSGQAPNAAAGLPILERLQERAGEKLVIMPGGGIRPENAAVFYKSGFKFVHASATLPVERLTTKPPVPMNSERMLDETMLFETNVDRIRDILEKIG